MPDPDLCRYLEWDSDFFRLRIARVVKCSMTDDDVPIILSWCDAHHIDCLYFLCDSGDSSSVAVAERGGFEVVDRRLTLGRSTVGISHVNTPYVRKARPEDLPALKAIARKSHRDSRFYADVHFPRSDCDRLYETWIENSCAGFADHVVVAECNGKPAGYMTCHLLPAGKGQIGLVAVADWAQGKGLGRAMMEAVLRWLGEHNATDVSVVTQARNARALRFYESSGFNTKSVELWLHRWFGSKAKAMS